jgi:hypothetical protein
MPEWPHEYTVDAWQPELAAQFEAMCRTIAVRGVVESWPPPPEQRIYHHPYLVAPRVSPLRGTSSSSSFPRAPRRLTERTESVGKRNLCSYSSV